MDIQKAIPVGDTKVASAINVTQSSFIHKIIRKTPGVEMIPDNIFSFHVYYKRPYNVNDYDTVWFQLTPENIREDKSANYTSHDILGRFEPIRMYSGSSPTSISFTISYIWLSNDATSFSSWNQLKANILKLKALTFPVNLASKGNVNSKDLRKLGKIAPPPLVKFNYGDIFINVDCLVKSVSITYNSPWNDDIKPAFAAGTDMGALGFLSKIFSLPTFGSDTRVTGWDITNAGKIFPLKTDISISLETAYPLMSWLTYQDIRDSYKTTPPAALELIKDQQKSNTVIGEKQSAMNSINNTIFSLQQVQR